MRTSHPSKHQKEMCCLALTTNYNDMHTRKTSMKQLRLAAQDPYSWTSSNQVSARIGSFIYRLFAYETVRPGDSSEQADFLTAREKSRTRRSHEEQGDSSSLLESSETQGKACAA
jgi:hypothetical protein